MKERKISFSLKTFIPIFIVGLIMECAVLSAFLVKKVGIKDIVILFAAVVFLSAVLAVIPLAKNIVAKVMGWIKGIPAWAKNNKKEIIKVVVLLIGVSVVAILPTVILVGMLDVKIKSYVVPGVYMIAWAAVFFIVFGIIYRKTIATNIEGWVFILILLLGMSYIFAEPITCGMTWDDQTHFDQASNIASDYELMMPNAIHDFTAEAHKSTEKFDTEFYDTWLAKLEAEYANPTVSTAAGLKPVYQKWAYIPAGIFLLFARALHMSFAHAYMMGKFGYLLLFAILIYFSMKKLKGGKMIVATIALLPEVLFQASNYTYDSWVIGWLIFGFCCFIHELQNIDKKLDTVNVVWMMLAFFLGVAPKAIYIPLMCLCYFMPKEKFESARQRKIYYIALTVVILLVMASFVMPFLSSNGGGTGDVRGGDDINSSEQTAYILHNPGIYLVTCWNFFKNFVAFQDWPAMTSFLAYNGMVPFKMTSVIMLLVVAFTDKSKEDENMRWYHRIVTAILCIGVTVMIITVMYISFTPVGADTVAGCQPRYLLPMMFPMLYIVGSSKMENNTNKIAYRGTILAISCLVVLFGVWTNIIGRFN